MAPPNVDNMITLKVDNVPFTIACVRLSPLPARTVRRLTSVLLVLLSFSADELRELFDKYVLLMDRIGELTSQVTYAVAVTATGSVRSATCTSRARAARPSRAGSRSCGS